jgi:hypothetical protein
MIPAVIGEAGFRFIKIKIKDKTPCESEYQTINNYSIDDPRLLYWITPVPDGILKGNFGNYAALCTPTTAILELDTMKMVSLALEIPEFSNGFIVQSGSGRGAHFYFRTDSSRTIPLMNKDGLNVGHLKGNPSGYCLAPGSIHPCGKEYVILQDSEIPFIPFDKITEHFKDYIPQRITPTAPALSSGENFDIDVPIERVLMPDNPHRMGNEIKGAHPVHGSTTGANLSINTQKNTWHCHRCGTGGGVALGIAVAHGFIQCHEALPGVLRGKLFSEVLTIAEREYGWKNTRDNDVDLSSILKMG